MNRADIERGLQALKAEAKLRGITAPDWLKADIHYYERQLANWEDPPGPPERPRRDYFYWVVGLGLLAIFASYALAQNL